MGCICMEAEGFVRSEMVSLALRSEMVSLAPPINKSNVKLYYDRVKHIMTSAKSKKFKGKSQSGGISLGAPCINPDSHATVCAFYELFTYLIFTGDGQESDLHLPSLSRREGNFPHKRLIDCVQYRDDPLIGAHP